MMFSQVLLVFHFATMVQEAREASAVDLNKILLFIFFFLFFQFSIKQPQNSYQDE